MLGVSHISIFVDAGVWGREVGGGGGGVGGGGGGGGGPITNDALKFRKIIEF